MFMVCSVRKIKLLLYCLIKDNYDFFSSKSYQGQNVEYDLDIFNKTPTQKINKTLSYDESDECDESH